MIEKKKRDTAMDILRCVACFMVVFLHVCGMNWSTMPTNSWSWRVLNIYDSMVRASVPLFIMISGAFLLNPQKQLVLRSFFHRHIVTIIIGYLFWSFFFACFTTFNIIINSSLIWDINTVIKMIIEKWLEGHYHLWYIPIIIGLYLITPFLKFITAQSHQKLLKYGMILFLVFGVLTQTILAFPHPEWLEIILHKIPIPIFASYTGYFLLGHYFYQYPPSSKSRFCYYLLGLVSIIACASIEQYMFDKTGVIDGYLYGYFSITTFLESCAIFIFFRSLKEKTYSEKFRMTIDKFAKYTLGIYFIHPLFLTLISENLFTTTSFFPLFSVPVLSVLTWLLSLLVVMVLKKIPIINKYVV